MGRLLTGLGGALGLAWLWRVLTRQRAQHEAPQPDPAAELREKLAQAKEAADDRDEFDASEGQPVDEIDRTPPAAEPAAAPEPEASVSLDERRRAIHEKAQQALGEMGQLGRDD
jgi:hypothetical protein